MARYVSVVLSNPVAGREAEFNDWYTEVHLADVLAIPGIVAATRYRRVGKDQGGAFGGYQYLALYELETDDLRGVFRELVARVGTAILPMSDAIGQERAYYDWDVIMPRRYSAEHKDE